MLDLMFGMMPIMHLGSANDIVPLLIVPPAGGNLNDFCRAIYCVGINANASFFMHFFRMRCGENKYTKTFHVHSGKINTSKFIAYLLSLSFRNRNPRYVESGTLVNKYDYDYT
jgi:hypothetical protein